MTDVAVVILIRDEAIHLRRCLERLVPLEPREVWVVDSPSRDEGPEIVRAFAPPSGAWSPQLVAHDWPGTQALQFNWALDHLPIRAEWVLRLDADEYLAEGTVAEMRARLSTLPTSVAGIELTLRMIWRGHEICHGTSGIKMPRMFRRGRGRYDDTAVMDEKLVIDGELMNDGWQFFDHNLNSHSWWMAKHRGYAVREAERFFSGLHGNKAAYYRMPRYLRVVAYWGFRYFVRLGFLDGWAGWTWNFWHALWYRSLVDRIIGEQMHAEALGRSE